MTPASIAPAAEPLGGMPRLSSRHVRFASVLARTDLKRRIEEGIAWLNAPLGQPIDLGTPEVLWRAAGLQRPGVIAQLTWPRRSSRIGLGIETPLAHALVDRLLGFDRRPGEERLQVTPVEWGILTFAIARTLTQLAKRSGESAPWDLILDRVGPEPFEPEDLGAIITLRWNIALNEITGAVRLWLPESVVARALAEEATSPREVAGPELRGRFGELTGIWRAEAGTVTLQRGLHALRKGGVLPIEGSPLRGTPASPTGIIELALPDRETRSWFRAEPVALSGGRRLTLIGPLQRKPSPREAIPVPPSTETPGGGSVPPADVPVTLTVELGRISLPLHRLADLRPGDVLELGRHSKEPVELTSGGRLIARGELVLVDTELAVRVTNVFL